MDKPKHGGKPSVESQKLRKTACRMLNDGYTPDAIRHEIVTDDSCTEMEKRSLLQELHMEG